MFSAFGHKSLSVLCVMVIKGSINRNNRCCAVEQRCIVWVGLAPGGKKPSQPNILPAEAIGSLSATEPRASRLDNTEAVSWGLWQMRISTGWKLSAWDSEGSLCQIDEPSDRQLYGENSLINPPWCFWLWREIIAPKKSQTPKILNNTNYESRSLSKWEAGAITCLEGVLG